MARRSKCLEPLRLPALTQPAYKSQMSNRPAINEASIIELIFLGTGTSAGIPMIACHCEVCDIRGSA